MSGSGKRTLEKCLLSSRAEYKEYTQGLKMRITADIAYDSESVATFDPQKVLVRLYQYFPTATSNERDYAAEEVQRFEAFLTDQGTPEPMRSRLLRQIRGKAERNGPCYLFHIEQPPMEHIHGRATRYYTDFFTEGRFDVIWEQRIIQFLQSLHLGTLECDTTTAAFCYPHPSYPDHWTLAPSTPPLS